MSELNYFVHPSSIVDKGATIGDGTKVWHFCHIMPTASIGSNCILGQNCFVGNHVVIGNGVKIQNNVSLYEGVIIEDDVFLGPSMVFTNVHRPRAFLEQKTNFLQSIVRKGATIGANATIVCGHTIGKYAFIGAGSLVNEDVPDYALVVGVPCKRIGFVSRQGQRLKFDDSGNAKCPTSNERYQLRHGKVYRFES
jgi:UDP-2-acetamido-3-amino-2,3-dideoxy-glucuronate N-acetyltransferase